jgi:hypothetical protein
VPAFQHHSCAQKERSVVQALLRMKVPINVILVISVHLVVSTPQKYREVVTQPQKVLPCPLYVFLEHMLHLRPRPLAVIALRVIFVLVMVVICLKYVLQARIEVEPTVSHADCVPLALSHHIMVAQMYHNAYHVQKAESVVLKECRHWTIVLIVLLDISAVQAQNAPQ